MNPFDPGYFETPELRTFGFKSVGENVRIAKNCVIIGPENIEIGDNTRIDAFTSLMVANGSLRLGSYVHIHTYCLIGGRGDVEIGDYSGMSHGAKVLSASDSFDGQHMTCSVAPPECLAPTIAPVRIGRHVIVGCNSMILPGVTLGDGAAIGAGSLVNRSLPEWAIYAGTPARRLRERSRRLLALEQHRHRVAA